MSFPREDGRPIRRVTPCGYCASGMPCGDPRSRAAKRFPTIRSAVNPVSGEGDAAPSTWSFRLMSKRKNPRPGIPLRPSINPSANRALFRQPEPSSLHLGGDHYLFLRGRSANAPAAARFSALVALGLRSTWDAARPTFLLVGMVITPFRVARVRRSATPSSVIARASPGGRPSTHRTLGIAPPRPAPPLPCARERSRPPAPGSASGWAAR